MTWTTSAYPWAEHARASREYSERRPLLEPSRNDTPSVLQFLASRLATDPPAMLQIAILGHFALVASLLAFANDAATTLALLTSSIFLALAALRAIRALEGSSNGGDIDTGAAIEEKTRGMAFLIAAHPASQMPFSATERGALETARPNVHNPDWADLMARMSHELRTPLNAVLGFSDVMHKGLLGPLGHERYHEYARHIHESGRELLKSAEDALAVTSLLATPDESRQRECLSLRELLRDAWSFFGERPAAQGVTCRIDIDPGFDVFAERRTLRQALVNLLSEGLARATPGTAIAVTATSSLGRIALRISVEETSAACARGPCSLDICLARKLLELQGAEVIEEIDDTGLWQVSTRLDQAVQPDFFSARA